MKKILIINGHPNKESFCFAPAESYKKGADAAGADCELVHLIDLKFNPILTSGKTAMHSYRPVLNTP